MATKTLQELQENLKDALDVANDTSFDQDIRDKAQQTADRINAEIANMQMQQSTPVNTSMPTPAPTPTPAPVAQVGNAVDAVLASLRAMMLTGQGSGVDSDQVRMIIEQYLKTQKISISDLDSSVIDEIKKNQMLYVQLPNFGLPIQMSKRDSEIPNLFSIIDDILAGNNVYLIGEAGGGKTYTAEQVAKILQREIAVINCSQYTSPIEIIGGQTIEGFKKGKLIDAWQGGKILLLDEMPKLDPNTAGLFNDAFAKSSKTKPDDEAKIYSANPEEPPIPRAKDFAVMATGNTYPNKKPEAQYLGNNQQDLSLLDRFSGSVYYTEFDKNIDESMCRFQFLYDMLVGNYYEWKTAERNGTTKPTPRGLRTIVEAEGMKNLAVLSYRTITAFRVAFEIELVRNIEASRNPNFNKEMITKGKTLLKAYNSYLVAFGQDGARRIIQASSLTDAFVQNQAQSVIDKIVKAPNDFKDLLTPSVKEVAVQFFEQYKDMAIAQENIV
jgi:cobaltochelatase CobS